MSESLPLLFRKERCEWFACDSSKSHAKKRANRMQKRSESLNKFAFFVCFWKYFPSFNAQERIAPVALRSCALFSRATWTICSWQKSGVSHSLFFTSESLFHSQKRANCSKNRWVNSQPWIFVNCKKCQVLMILPDDCKCMPKWDSLFSVIHIPMFYSYELFFYQINVKQNSR